MYNIKFTYLKNDELTEVEFDYIVDANSYEESIEIVRIEANKRIEKRGGTIISII
jgi:hypothetical protein